MTRDWLPPKDHPINEDVAKKLILGPLGDEHRKIIATACAPIYWYSVSPRKILDNGTLTIAKTPNGLIGITAAHVINGYLELQATTKIGAQVFDASFDDLADRIICKSDKLDLATVRLSEADVKAIGKPITPLPWPPKNPQEGRGIMLGGFPGSERIEFAPGHVNFGLFTGMGIAGVVTDYEIAWTIEREFVVEDKKIKTLPEKASLGGISGGPMIAWFETESHVAYPCLAGIIVEHPEHSEGGFGIERFKAARADVIDENGWIHGPS